MQISILLAEDDAASRALVQELLAEWPGNGAPKVVAAATPEAALEAAQKQSFTLGLIDLNYKGSKSDGFELLQSLRAGDPRLELIVLSSATTFEAVQTALRAGANDYLAKGFGRGELYHALEKALERRRWRKLENRVANEAAPVMAMAGSSFAMKSLVSSIKKFGASHAPVLIFGETGTGKELAARGLHACSADPAAAFVAVNCAAVPATLADAFFFGHERGAFTGADRARAGVFEEADGGTIFLDEVNSLPGDMQGKLLRVLEQKEIRRVGGQRTIPVEFRLIAATNANLEELLKKSSFREDLYYRLNTLELRVPALRERIEDLPELAQLFQPERVFSKEAWAVLEAHSWPGNIRELRNLLMAMDAMAEPGEALGVEHIPEHLLKKFSEAAVGAEESAGPDDLTSFHNAQGQRETEYLRRAYRSAGGNVSRMARMMSADRSHLHQKLVKLGIHSSKR
ncbi:MAG: sigma-54-dependent transcriptional regulator [Bdellovibrionota bacterium]